MSKIFEMPHVDPTSSVLIRSKLEMFHDSVQSYLYLYKYCSYVYLIQNTTCRVQKTST